MRSGLAHSFRTVSRRRRIPYVWHTLAACSVSTAARELLTDWQWVPFEDPPDWLTRVAGFVTILLEIWLLAALCFPSLAAGHRTGAFAWMAGHPAVAFLGLTIGWSFAYMAIIGAGCAVANLILFLGRSICFPMLVLWRWGIRVVGCGQVLGHMLDVLDCWLAPDDTIRIFRQIMPHIRTADAFKWRALSPAKTVSRLVELQSGELLSHFPIPLWPELVTSDLSSQAMGILFRRSLRHNGTMFRAISGAMVSHNWFSDPDRGRLLVGELAALPPDRLASALETVAELSRLQTGTAIQGILKGVQELGDAAALGRFQAALAWAPAQVSEALFACK